MRKYLLFVFAAFIFSGICLAQDAQELSIEEQLKLLGADDFFISDVNADSAKTAQKDEFSEQSDSLETDDSTQAQSDSIRTAVGASTESSGRRQPMSSASMMPAGMGQRGPVLAKTDTIISNCREIDGNEICDTTFNIVGASAEKISVFDTASVAEERTIDFSRNLSQYRSPQKALLYSLLVPGLGQAYNKNYWRTGLYAAIEIGMITGAIYFRQDARKIRENAENFANSHFDKDKLEDFYKKLTDYGYTKYPADTEEPENSVNVGDFIFGLGRIFTDDTTFAYEKYMEHLKEDFYGNIGDFYAVQGWKDASFRILDIDTNFISPPYVSVDGIRGFGTSQNQRHFNSLIDESGKQGRRSSAFVAGIFVNHIASAMDAFISTIIHNRKLLRDEKGEPMTKTEEILSRISIDGDMYLNKSGELTSKLGFVWRF